MRSDPACLVAVLGLFSSAAVAAPSDEAGNSASQRGDYTVALRELTPRARDGNAQAQVVLAGMYFKGEGVSKDPGEALKWYEAAAEQGNAEAQFFAGAMRLMAIGTSKDVPRALKWLKRSADQGMPDAQVLLGMTYTRGREVPRDLVEADTWFQLAAARGDPLAPSKSMKVEQAMTSDQIAAARARVAAWQPKPAGETEGMSASPVPRAPSSTRSP